MDRRFYLFTRIWAVLAFALFAVTWRLWIPQSSFPQIPFFEFLVPAPGWLDWVALSIVGVSLFACVLSKPPGDRSNNAPSSLIGTRRFNWFRFGHLVFAIAFAFLISLDQNRLQPWAYHFLILGLLIGLASPRQASSMIRFIAVSIYVYSAISKFDYQFVHTVGDQMLSTLFGFAGIETVDWSTKLKCVLVILLPVGELLVGIGLAMTKFRGLAVVAAIGLHVALLLILGPWGLNHQPGVLIWNLFFLLQALILFWPNKKSDHRDEIFQPRPEIDRQNPFPNLNRNYNWLALLITIFVLWFPLTQWIGVCDHWPAWQVYSPSSSRAQLRNERSVSQWSLEELGVPVYPQARFQLAVAFAVVEKNARKNRADEEERFQIELGNQSNRFSGERVNEVLTRSDQFKMKTSRFLLNTRARDTWFE